jgi:hypothetical protein
MKIARNILGGLMVLVGIVWLLQGTGLLQGSVMTGQSMWTIIGIIVLILGAVLLYFTNWRASRPTK